MRSPCPRFTMAPPLPTSDLCLSSATQAFPASAGLSDRMSAALDAAPSGSCVSWGIPFEISEPVILTDRPVSVDGHADLCALARLPAHIGPPPAGGRSGRDHLPDARRGPAGGTRRRLRDPLRRTAARRGPRSAAAARSAPTAGAGARTASKRSRITSPSRGARATSRLRRHGAGAKRASCPRTMARG